MDRGRGGVEYEDLVQGTGPVAERGCVVEVSYSLSVNHGEQVQERKNYTFKIGERRVIAGLEYGVEGMRVGGSRRIRVGPHLAYRMQGVAGAIPANAVLQFDVALLGILANGQSNG